jgi:oligopeptide/dipeptide ABC transporter ATP-binding protein
MNAARPSTSQPRPRQRPEQTCAKSPTRSPDASPPNHEGILGWPGRPTYAFARDSRRPVTSSADGMKIAYPPAVNRAAGRGLSQHSARQHLACGEALLTLMGMLLITHDLGVIAGRSDRVVVMYAGRVVESGEMLELVTRRRHPYMAALMESIPHIPWRSEESPQQHPGNAARSHRAAEGVRFAPRCRYARTAAGTRTHSSSSQARSACMPASSRSIRLPRPMQAPGAQQTARRRNRTTAAIRWWCSITSSRSFRSGEAFPVTRGRNPRSLRCLAQDCHGRDTGPGGRIGMRHDYARKTVRRARAVQTPEPFRSRDR